MSASRAMTRRATVAGVAIAWLLAASKAVAQVPADSAREAMYHRYLDFSSLIRGGYIVPRWLPDGRRFWFADDASGETVILEVDPRAGTVRRPFDVKRLRAAIAGALGHMPDAPGVPFRDFRFAPDGRDVDFTVAGRRLRLRLGSYAVTALEATAASDSARFAPRPEQTLWGGPEILSPDSTWFALSRDGNLWLRSTADGREVQLTSGGTERFGWTTRIAAWSPDGRRLAAMRSDMRDVHFMPVVDWLSTRERASWQPYWLTGQSLPRDDLWIYDVTTKRAIRVAADGAEGQGLHLAGFDSAGSELLFLRHDRFSKWLELAAANTTTGVVRPILTERQETFVAGLRFSGVADRLYTPLAGGRFLWLSERDGWMHVYLYDRGGTLIRRLTTGAFPVHEVVAVDERMGWVYFTASAERERPYDVHLYRVDMRGTRVARLTEAAGQHRVAFGPMREFFVDTHASLTRPAVSELRRADGRLVRVLARANADALATLRWRPPEEFVVKAADGVTDLRGVLFTPSDFDPSKRYPVVDFIYAGVQSSVAPKTIYDIGGCALVACAQAVAQLGFVTFVVDGRGTPLRGKAFQDVAYRAMGQFEIPDHVAALRQLAASRPYIDLERAGIVGYSFGGYHALRGLLLAPNVYKVGVVGAPIVEFESGTPGIVEPYLGPLEQNRELYAAASNLRLVDSLAAKMLLVHGTADVNAPFAHSMKLADALIRANKAFDLLVVPGQDHVQVGYTCAYCYEAMRRYLQEHLAP